MEVQIEVRLVWAEDKPQLGGKKEARNLRTMYNGLAGHGPAGNEGSFSGSSDAERVHGSFRNARSGARRGCCELGQLVVGGLIQGQGSPSNGMGRCLEGDWRVVEWKLLRAPSEPRASFEYFSTLDTRRPDYLGQESRYEQASGRSRG